MYQSTSQCSSSHRGAADPVSLDGSIGDLFRKHGESFIKHYHPTAKQIKLIRSIRVCKTPALGSRTVTCTNCGDYVTVYNSCGNSHCMICQSIKREQWVDRLKNKLLAVPYTHIVFTMPHSLNGLARRNPEVMYGMIQKVSWLMIKKLFSQELSEPVTPGMISVLHTFGSDMKYHIHVHALLTFGGLNKNGDWIYPKHKKRIARYRTINKIYKSIFIDHLRIAYEELKLKDHIGFNERYKEIEKSNWVVHHTHPTMDIDVISNYLARYINRIAITKNRLQYLDDKQEVVIRYNDYNNQIDAQAAPKEIKILHPMDAIAQILQHVLPQYFQKSRSY